MLDFHRIAAARPAALARCTPTVCNKSRMPPDRFPHSPTRRFAGEEFEEEPVAFGDEEEDMVDMEHADLGGECERRRVCLCQAPL